LLAPELFIAGKFQRFVERPLIIAAVVDKPRCGLKREFLGSRKVFPPHFHRIDFQFLRYPVHQPLDDVGRLRPAGTAIRVRGHFVGERRSDLDADRRDLIAAGKHEPGKRWNSRREELMIGADVGDDLVAQT